MLCAARYIPCHGFFFVFVLNHACVCVCVCAAWPLPVFVLVNLWLCRFTHHRKSIKIYSIKIIDFMKNENTKINWKKKIEEENRTEAAKQKRKEIKSGKCAGDRASQPACTSTYMHATTHCTTRTLCAVLCTQVCKWILRSWYVNMWE